MRLNILFGIKGFKAPLKDLTVKQNKEINCKAAVHCTLDTVKLVNEETLLYNEQLPTSLEH